MAETSILSLENSRYDWNSQNQCTQIQSQCTALGNSDVAPLYVINFSTAWWFHTTAQFYYKLKDLMSLAIVYIYIYM